MQAAGVKLGLEYSPEIRLDQLEQCLSPRARHVPGSAEMCGICAFLDEVAEHKLVRQADIAVNSGAYPQNRLSKRLRHKHETEPKRAEQHAVQARHGDDALRFLNAQWRFRRLPVEASFSVIFLLDDPGASFARPGEELRSPLAAHRDSGRELRGGRNQYERR